MKRLFLSIYAVLIGSLVTFVALAGIAWMLFANQLHDGSPRSEFIVRIAEKYVLQANNSNEDLLKSLNDWSEISGFELALYDKSGDILAKTTHYQPNSNLLFDVSRYTSVKLSQGRVLKMGHKNKDKQHGFYFILVPLFGLALTVALVSYPFVRRLTSRLERLTQGVAMLGQKRGVRVEIEGCDECALLAKTFNDTSEKLDNLILSQKSLLANASHELRSPLTRLRMAVEGVSIDTPPAVLTEIRTNITELDALIDELLLASRLEAQGIAQEKEAVDIITLLMEEVKPFHVKPNISVMTTPYILGESKLLRRLLRNLLENAQKHSDGKSISANAYNQNRLLLIDIEDDGAGIEPTEREKIFEPFYRKGGHGEAKGGVGLGLSLVRRIAREHGGEVVCLEGKAGKGALFRVTLPII